MALDQGTTSSRCLLFNEAGEIVSAAQKEIAQIYPRPGWVEQDPMEIWSSQVGVCLEALAKIGAAGADVAALGITNQRETVVVWDKHTGKPVYNAIVWQCRRTAQDCDALRQKNFPIQAKTGLLPDAYFSGTKVKWILDHVPGAREEARRGQLLFGTVDTWLVWRLTQGRRHATDVSNASRTMLFNIHTMAWDGDILEELDIPRAMLPEVLPSAQVYGVTGMFGGEVSIAGVAGDQQASLFGQGCRAPGMVKNTYGTGCFLLMHTGKTPVASRHSLLTTVAWDAGYGVEYALEGSVFSAGATVQWLRDELGLVENAAQTEQYAQAVADTNGVYLVPAFTGLGAPYWDPYARGAILGLTRGATAAHIVRAALESLAYQTLDVLRAMETDAGVPIRHLNADGGASANKFLMQFQADILNLEVARPPVIENTALGAALLAGLGAGVYSPGALPQAAPARIFTPRMAPGERAARVAGWAKAVGRALNWADRNEEGEAADGNHKDV
jgi:glycerol kinase